MSPSSPSVSASTPLLPSHAPSPSPPSQPHAHPSALPRPPWAFDLRLQYHLQLGLSSLAIVLAALTVWMAAGSSTTPTTPTTQTQPWRRASTLTLAGIGLVLDFGVLFVLLQYGKHQAPGEGREGGMRKNRGLLPLTAQILFNASVLAPYRVLVVVLSLTTTSTTTTTPTTATAGEKIEEVSLAALLAMAAFSQLLCSMYFFRLARIWRAFDDATKEQQQQQQQQLLLSRQRQGLRDLFQALGLKPTVSEMAELAAVIEAEEEEVEAKAAGSSSNSSSRGDDTGLTFDDVCRILSHYTKIHASRKHRRHQRRRALEAVVAGGEGSGTQLSSPLRPPAAAQAAAQAAAAPTPQSLLGNKKEDGLSKEEEQRDGEQKLESV